LYICGVDGGGSKTSCLIANERGEVLGFGISGPSNITTVGMDTCVKNILKAFKEASKGAISRADFMCIALAGAGSKRRQRLIRNALSKLNIARKIDVIPDVCAILHTAISSNEGIVVIAGTGSIVVGIVGSIMYRAGGWGYLVDDEGSAFHIGREAIRLALKMYDGRLSKTRLMSKVLEHFNVSNMEELVDLIALRKVGVKEIASLAPKIIDFAKHDTIARFIVKNACNELVDSVISILNKMNKRVPIVLSGGLLINKKAYRDMFINELRRRLGDTKVLIPKFEPVVGALIRAYTVMDMPNAIEILEDNIRRKYPFLVRGEDIEEGT